MAPLFCLFHNLHKQPLQIMAPSNACRFIPVKVNEAETPADDDAFSLFSLVPNAELGTKLSVSSALHPERCLGFVIPRELLLSGVI